MNSEDNPYFLMGAMLGEKSGEVADLRRRIEELEALYEAARHDAQEAEAYAEALEVTLGRAEWLLCDAMVQLRDGKIRTRRNRAGLIEAFLEELKGQNQ